MAWEYQYHYQDSGSPTSVSGGGTSVSGGGSSNKSSNGNLLNGAGGGIEKIYDISFAGSRVVIGGAKISDFMDDANPIDIQDTDSTNIEWSCNGRMIRTIKPAAVILSVTVIPGSPSDHALRTIWKRSFCNGGTCSLNEANESLSCSINTGNPKIGNFVFTGGTPLSGAAGITSNGQGKMGGNTYTFAFENIE